MRVITVTGGTNLNVGGATPFVAKGVQPANSLPFQVLVLQYGGTGTAYIGDSSVSSTNGIALTSSSAPLVIAPGMEYTSDLYEWFGIIPTGQKLTVLMLD